jgi:hypothetical protein
MTQSFRTPLRPIFFSFFILPVDFSLNLIDIFRRFVSPQKACDKEAGLDLLKQFESLPVKETSEFGFSLVETAIMLEIIVDHQRRLKKIDESLRTATRQQRLSRT